MNKLNLNKKGIIKRGLNKFKGFSKKKKALVIIGGLMAVNTVAMIFSVSSSKAEPMSKEEMAVYEERANEKQKENSKPENVITKKIKEVIGDNLDNVEFNIEAKNINVIFQVPENLTNKLTVASGELEIYNTIKSLQNNEWITKNIDNISFEGYFDLVDKFGEVTNSRVMMSRFDVAAINKINFSNVLREEVFKNFDESRFIHPALRK